MSEGGRIEGRIEDVEGFGLRRGGVHGSNDAEFRGRGGEGLEGRFEFRKERPQGRYSCSHIGHCESLSANGSLKVFEVVNVWESARSDVIARTTYPSYVRSSYTKYMQDGPISRYDQDYILSMCTNSVICHYREANQ